MMGEFFSNDLSSVSLATNLNEYKIYSILQMVTTSIILIKLKTIK